MLERIRTSAGLQWSRVRFGRSPGELISFSNAVTGAKSLLMVMPLDKQAAFPTQMIVQMAKEIYGDAKITIVRNDHSLDTTKLLPRSQFVQILDDETNLFFLPAQAVLSRVRTRQYDVALDLNLDLVLPSGYIVRESNARVRIGFARKGADTFYNFLIQPDQKRNARIIYQRLAKCLRMF